MARRLIFLNVLLLAATTFLTYELYSSVGRFNEENDVAKLKAEALKRAVAKKSAPYAPAQPPEQKMVDMDEFQLVVDKNLFSEDRTSPKEKAQVVVPELNPLPLVLGVMISGEPQALIQSPVRTAQGRTQSEVVKLGDLYQGYRITRITPEEVVLTYGEGLRSYNLKLFDPNRPRPQAQPPRAFLPSPPMPVHTVSGQQPTPQQVVAQPQPQAQQPISPPQAESAKGQPSIPDSRIIIKDGKKYIRTPFGDVPQDN